MTGSDPFLLLTNHLREACRKAGGGLDAYDPDFLLGTIVLWLQEHDAVLTGQGVTEGLVAQLAAARVLCSRMGFALDTATLALTSPRRGRGQEDVALRRGGGDPAPPGYANDQTGSASGSEVRHTPDHVYEESGGGDCAVCGHLPGDEGHG